MAAEVKRIISGHVDFTAVCREHTIPLLTTDQRQLVDIDLILYSLPSLAPITPDQQLIGGQDFRLYFNDLNVTEALKQQLNLLVSAVPVLLVRQLYLAAANRYVQYASALGGGSGASDLAFAQQYAALDDWDHKFDTLGDRRIGASGNLHPLSFIYRFIPIRPVRLSDVWTAHRNNNAALPEKLGDIENLHITFSEGPPPSFENFEPKTFLPAGRLIYQLELAYTNPLEPALKQIASRLRLLAQELETLRVHYLDPMASDLQTLRNDFEQNANTVTQELDRLRLTVEQIAGP
jgi:hypothetical protein